MNKIKLLVIDDEYHIRLFFFEEFEKEGFDVVTSDGNQDILKLVDREKPHAVILDINLEEKHNGLDLLRKIRSKDQKIPVILCSALQNMRDDLQTIDADWFVSKSIDITELKMSVRNLLDMA
ncbi:MAG: response regulator [Desulfovibrionales bacterium]|nr:MAG: response regulator [Desulfovibrionales bacterium]